MMGEIFLNDHSYSSFTSSCHHFEFCLKLNLLPFPLKLPNFCSCLWHHHFPVFQVHNLKISLNLPLSYFMSPAKSCLQTTLTSDSFFPLTVLLLILALNISGLDFCNSLLTHLPALNLSSTNLAMGLLYSTNTSDFLLLLG